MCETRHKIHRMLCNVVQRVALIMGNYRHALGLDGAKRGEGVSGQIMAGDADVRDCRFVLGQMGHARNKHRLRCGRC